MASSSGKGLRSVIRERWKDRRDGGKIRTISDVLHLGFDEDLPFKHIDLAMVFIDDFQSLIDNYNRDKK